MALATTRSYLGCVTVPMLERRTHVSCDPCGIATDEGMVGDIFGNNSSCCDKREPPNLYTANNDGACSDGGTLANESRDQRLGSQFYKSSGSQIVSKDHMRTQKNVVLDGDPIPDGDTVFYGNAVADLGAVFDKTMLTNIAVGAHPSLWHYVRKSPNARACSDIGTLDVCEGVNFDFCRDFFGALTEHDLF